MPYRADDHPLKCNGCLDRLLRMLNEQDEAGKASAAATLVQHLAMRHGHGALEAIVKVADILREDADA